MKFAFLIHPLTAETSRLLDFLTRDRSRRLRESWGQDLLNFCAEYQDAVRQEKRRSGSSPARPEVRVVDRLEGLVSARGSVAEGRLYEIPMAPRQILEEPAEAIELIRDAIRQAADWGAELVGLGSMTGIVGGQGTYLAEHSPIPVTTGNSLTVRAAVENLSHACREVEIDLAEEDVAVIGIPGSIASAAARMLSGKCRSLTLVARRPSTRAAEMAKELDAELVFRIPACVERARIIFSATSSGDCIEQAWLQPGSVLLDVGVPTDVRGTEAQRDDVLFLSGGLSRVPESMPLDSIYLRFHQGMAPSCLAETMVLALENRAECFSLGRSLRPERIQEIGDLAHAHGFRFTRLFSFGLPLEDSSLLRFRKVLRRMQKLVSGEKNGRHGLRNGSSRVLPETKKIADRAAILASRHLNPVSLALGGKTGLVKTFVRGEGTEVVDAEGRRYLDFVAGFGSLNLGHNHPAIVEAIHEVMRSSPPGFSPSAVNPWAAALAERLAVLAPGDLEMVFFANSGTEAVEAALKLARAATGREGLLYCERSFHGKTLGSLSVTGNPDYRRPFAPLVPKCRAIPYGDLDALERALRGRRFAAFLVEPLQAEGGMNVPPEGYLREAQRLCRKAGTLLAVDEVQTGLGRTGRMFAVEHEEVESDILMLAKSLGGGVVPIGAMLTRRDLWQKAYGSLQTFLLHTSTFGGGSLACAAGLATLKVIEREQLSANAASRGMQLLDGLGRFCRECDLFVGVRGRGLLGGLEFKPAPPRLVALWKEVGTGSVHPYLTPDFDSVLRSGPSFYVMQTLLMSHGIYTQVARSQPLVLRLEPPLTISAAEIDRFLRAIADCCRDLEGSYKMFDGITAKSALGQHRANQSPTAQETQTPREEQPSRSEMP